MQGLAFATIDFLAKARESQARARELIEANRDGTKESETMTTPPAGDAVPGGQSGSGGGGGSDPLAGAQKVGNMSTVLYVIGGIAVVAGIAAVIAAMRKR